MLYGEKLYWQKLYWKAKTWGIKTTHSFKDSEYTIDCINQYLSHKYDESVIRGYNFDRRKIDPFSHSMMLTVTNKQIEYELMHLLNKLKTRNKSQYIWLSSQKDIAPHPLFRIIKGEIEDWEIL